MCSYWLDLVCEFMCLKKRKDFCKHHPKLFFCNSLCSNLELLSLKIDGFDYVYLKILITGNIFIQENQPTI